MACSCHSTDAVGVLADVNRSALLTSCRRRPERRAGQAITCRSHCACSNAAEGSISVSTSMTRAAAGRDAAPRRPCLQVASRLCSCPPRQVAFAPLHCKCTNWSAQAGTCCHLQCCFCQPVAVRATAVHFMQARAHRNDEGRDLDEGGCCRSELTGLKGKGGIARGKLVWHSAQGECTLFSLRERTAGKGAVTHRWE